MGPGQTIALQTIAFSKASHSPKDYIPKGGAPDHQSAASVDVDTALFLRKTFFLLCPFLLQRSEDSTRMNVTVYKCCR